LKKCDINLEVIKFSTSFDLAERGFTINTVPHSQLRPLNDEIIFFRLISDDHLNNLEDGVLKTIEHGW
jgi:hypothetical protein